MLGYKSKLHVQDCITVWEISRFKNYRKSHYTDPAMFDGPEDQICNFLFQNYDEQLQTQKLH